MTLWGAILLGLVEGLTEFLPVSSTGHLILVGSALGFTGPQAVGFEIAIQLGAILSVVVYYRHRLRELLLGLRRDAGNRRLALSLGLAFLPAAIIGLATHRWIESHLFGAFTVAWALLLGGVIILVIEYRLRQSRITHLEAIGLREAWWVGLAQCLSLVPGVSRSGATIMGGLLVGMNRTTATEFSFLLALPTMLAATGYKIIKSHDLLFLGDPLLFPISLLVAFASGLAVVAGFLAFIKHHTFKPFAYYRIAVGLLILAIIG